MYGWCLPPQTRTAGCAGVRAKSLTAQPAQHTGTRAVEWATGPVEAGGSSDRLSPVSPLPRRAEVAGPTKAARLSNRGCHARAENSGKELAAASLIDRRRNSVYWLYRLICICPAPALASIVNSLGVPAPTQENLWAPVDIAKPEVTPIDVSAFALQAADTPVPTSVPHAPPPPQKTPTSEQSEPLQMFRQRHPQLIPAATETPGVVAMEIIEDTPTSEYKPPKPEDVCWQRRTLDRRGSHQPDGLCL